MRSRSTRRRRSRPRCCAATPTPRRRSSTRSSRAAPRPSEVIGSVLTPAIQRLGDAYGRGEVFLPQMMIAAEAMKVAVVRVKTYLPDSADSSEGRVVFATVKGDIHSIGKDICVSLLESQGFDVDDLGVDVRSSGRRGVRRCGRGVPVRAHDDDTAGDEGDRRRCPGRGTPVFVGGAVVTKEWAESIGAGYSADAPGCVSLVRALKG